jgi:hypothetical protein
MKTINIYPPGTKVQFKDIDVIGRITGINLRGEPNLAIMYEIGYFLNNQYWVNWHYENQLNFQEVEKVKIGFRELKEGVKGE